MIERQLTNDTKPTTKCIICGGATEYNEQLLGKNPKTHNYHAYCPHCHAFFSNAKDPKNRVIVWEDVKYNVYPQDEQNIARLKSIISQSMNEGNRGKKEPAMCSEHSEDALTWSVFNTLEKYSLLDKIFGYFSCSSELEGTRIYYWGYNDKYPNDKIIQEYVSVLNLAGEPKWSGGYSEPDVLLFNPKHGLINIEVKYMSPNDDKLRVKTNRRRNKRAQQMLTIGKDCVKATQVSQWVWYELLRMWVPGCLVTKHMNLQSFTLVNLLPKSLLEKEGGGVENDMQQCIKRNENFRFKQVTWEDFIQEVEDCHTINEKSFWEYVQRKFRN